MKVIGLIGIVCLGVCLSGCSTRAPDAGNVGQSATPLAANVTTVNGAPTAGVNSGAANQTSSNRFDPVKLRRVPKPGPVSGSPAPLDFRPGAENSEIATTMNEQGQPVEVRVFKDHPQLQRVEAVWLGPTAKLLKITLRDGNTVEVKTDSIANLASVSPDLLVQLATGSK